MTPESRISRMEGAYEQVNQRLGDYVESFAEISQRLQTLRGEIGNLRGEMRDLRGEMNANDTALREEINALRGEMNANDASIRRENRWIGGVIVAGIIVTVLSIIITRI